LADPFGRPRPLAFSAASLFTARLWRFIGASQYLRVYPNRLRLNDVCQLTRCHHLYHQPDYVVILGRCPYPSHLSQPCRCLSGAVGGDTGGGCGHLFIVSRRAVAAGHTGDANPLPVAEAKRRIRRRAHSPPP
jgi:hypothetical protein